MIGYVFFNESKLINNKIDNIEYVSSDGEIKGDTIAIFGSGSDYIILEDDTINLNIGDVIDLTILEDCRDYFLKGKDYWYMQKIAKSKSLNNELQCFTVDLQFQLDMLSV